MCFSQLFTGQCLLTALTLGPLLSRLRVCYSLAYMNIPVYVCGLAIYNLRVLSEVETITSGESFAIKSCFSNLLLHYLPIIKKGAMVFCYALSLEEGWVQLSTRNHHSAVSFQVRFLTP